MKHTVVMNGNALYRQHGILLAITAN